MRLRAFTPAAVLLLTCAAAHAADKTGTTAPTKTATFSMYCYWTGEATLGRVDGVVASRIGHWAGNEIVQVDYDPDRTDLTTLTRALQRQRSFYSVVVGKEDARRRAALAVGRNDVTQLEGAPHFIEPKHTLRQRHPDLYALDLTEEQAIVLNSWSYFGGKMPEVLTEEQQERLASR